MILSVNSVRKITYVGYSINPSKRIILHNKGKGAKFTRGKKWKIIYKMAYKTRSKALKEEYSLKKDKIKRNKIKMKFI